MGHRTIATRRHHVPLGGLIGASLVVALGACAAHDRAVVRHLPTATGLSVTAGQPPADSEPLGLLMSHRSGFYLFAFIPIVPVTIETCLERMVADAKYLGADGISNVTFSYSPASFFSFSALGLPDWTACVTMTGMAFKSKPASQPLH